MKIKTLDLKGESLNWAVAIAQGYDVIVTTTDFLDKKVHPHICIDNWDLHEELQGTRFCILNNWYVAGSILQREKLSLGNQESSGTTDNSDWYATNGGGKGGSFGFAGKDEPIVAIMRCYVMLKLGNEVDVPDELVVV